jgi:GntR family transcriptional regulator/MocR family aminotransferase
MDIHQTNRVTGLFLPWPGHREGAEAAHQRLAALIRAQINSRRLRSGDRLPPSRILAEELGVSRWVVTEAYDQLRAEGYLTARVGSGTIVAPGPAAPEPAPSADLEPARARPPVRFDLSPALPDLGSFPRPLWRGALTRALAEVGDDELGHPDPLGAPALRRTVATYLRRVRAIDTDPDRVLITQGVGSAVNELCAHLRASGARRVVVEDPSWPRLREIVRRQGLDVVPVGVDDGGLLVDLLVAADHEAPVAAVFAMPTHQFPTGVPLSAGRRRALLDWAAQRDAWIVEDDYDAEFRYDRHPVGAMASLGPERVIYLGSVSKTLSPSLHLGWMVVPAMLRPALADRRAGMPLVPTLDQLALAELVASGAYDRHLRRMRRHYRRRREALLAALVHATPGRAAPSMDAGLHVLWHLPPDTNEEAVVAGCRRAGLAVLGLGPCRVRSGGPGLVLGCANLPEHRAGDVAGVLAGLLGALPPGPHGSARPAAGPASGE